MDLSDLTVEVRDVNLVRKGQIEDRYLDAKLEPVFDYPGKWTVRLPNEHPLANELLQPGSGIIVTHTDPAVGVLLSGPSLSPARTADRTDPDGTSVFTGTTDDVILWRRVAYPTPSTADVTQQVSAYDVRSGIAETVMRAYVNANVGPGAPAARRIAALSLAPDLLRGVPVNYSARFDRLGDMLASLATVAGLGFRVVQIGAGLQFQVYDPTDKSSLIRLDMANGTLVSQSVTRSAPTLTRAIVAGQGVGEDRTLIEVATPTTTDETAWGMFGRIEGFIDQRNTDDPVELTQSGTEAILEGASGLAVQAVPGDDSTMNYPTDWGLGDVLGLVVDKTEASAQVTGATILINAASGVRIGASIGDVQGWDPQAGIRKTVAAQDERLSNLERNLESASSTVMAPGANLNTYTRDGTWDVDTVALANTLANLPVPPLPAVAPNMATNPRQLISQPVTTLPNGASWSVTHGASGLVATPAGTTTADAVVPVSGGAGLIASAYNMDGMSTATAPARQWTMRVYVNVAAEYRWQGVGAWVPLAAGGWVSIGQTVPANTYGWLDVRRAGGGAITGTEVLYITDVFCSYGIGSLRAAALGTLRTHVTPTRVIQEFEQISSVGGVRVMTWKRLRSSDGVTWGPWRMLDPAIPVNSEAEQDGLAKFLGANWDSPVSIRRNDSRSPVGYLTKNGDSWYSDFGTYPSAPNWLLPPMAAGWANYAAGFAPIAYRRTTLGIVMLRGLIACSAAAAWTTTPIFTLPVGYRPAGKRMMEVVGANAVARIDILPTGEVYLRNVVGLAANAAVSFLSLQLAFPVAEVAPESAWTDLAVQPGWYTYNTVDNSWPRASYWVDPVGRYWSRGLLGRATGPGAVDSPLVQYPAAASTTRRIHLSAIAVNIHCSMHFDGPGQTALLTWKASNTASSFVSLPWSPIVPIAVAPDAAYYNLGLNSPWANYGVASFPPASVWEAPDGLVHWRGLIGGGTAGTGIGSIGASFACTPSGNLIHAINAFEQLGRVDTTSVGMSFLSGNGGWVSLDGILYLREA